MEKNVIGTIVSFWKTIGVRVAKLCNYQWYHSPLIIVARMVSFLSIRSLPNDDGILPVQASK